GLITFFVTTTSRGTYWLSLPLWVSLRPRAIEAAIRSRLSMISAQTLRVCRRENRFPPSRIMLRPGLLPVPHAAREPPVGDPACEPHQDYSGCGCHQPVHHATRCVVLNVAGKVIARLRDFTENNRVRGRRLGPVSARVWTIQRPTGSRTRCPFNDHAAVRS